MSNDYTVYDLATGEVLRSGSAPGDIALQISNGEGVTPTVCIPDDFYFDLLSAKLKAKPELSLTVSPTSITADGNTDSIIYNIPEGALIIWPDGEKEIADGGDLEFSVDLPGVYLFKIVTTNYLVKEVTIEAIAAT